MTQDINPYSPPAVEELEAEQKDFPWYVAARGIYVQDGAVLPQIDLMSGDEGDHLLPVPHKVNLTTGKAPKLQTILLLVVIGGVIAIDLPVHWSVICASGAAYIVTLVFKKNYPRVNLTYFSPSRTKQSSTGRVVLQVLQVLLFFAGVGSLAFLEMGALPWLVFFVCILLSHLVSKRKEKIITRGLEIREATGTEPGNTGWVRIGGAHPTALAKLEKIQKHRGPLEPSEPHT